jgi:poly(A) polymerase
MSTVNYGVTPPISILPPTSRDLEVSRSLILELQKRNVYENVVEGRNRLAQIIITTL